MSHEPALFLVLHTLRLKGVAEVGAVAVATARDGDEVEAVLVDLAARGLVERTQGAPAGWALTSLGRKEDGRQVAEELDASGARDVVEASYREFLAGNPALLAACTAWQLQPHEDGDPPVINDHADPAYDAGVVARLTTIHEQVRPVLTSLAEALPRFGPYRGRLATALARVQAGEGDWFTRPLLDSYHSVWFELHEDLLTTLGLDRAHEGDHRGDHDGDHRGDEERPG